MSLPYFPGCTLYTKALGFHDSAVAVMSALGQPLEELPQWTCCGASYSQVTDNLLTLAGPTRILAEAALMGDRLVTACAFCFNTLKRTNLLLRAEEEKRKTVTDFIEKEYRGQVEVLHLLQVLRDELRVEGRFTREPGFAEVLGQGQERNQSAGRGQSGVPVQVGLEAVYQRVTQPLAGLRVASYYGCLLLRPAKEMALDDAEDPRVMEDLTLALGAEVVDYPHRTECCGSFLAVSKDSVTAERAFTILEAAARRGAQAVMVSCPLCQYNLDVHQPAMAERYAGFSPVPVFYFTQLMAMAFALDAQVCHFERHVVTPYEVLKQCIGAEAGAQASAGGGA
mgnify:CR=1 FL=1